MGPQPLVALAQQLDEKQETPAEGDGWLLDYVCTLWRAFPQMSMDFVWYELPMMEGWAYFRWALRNDTLARLFGGEGLGAGFLAQERERLVAEAVEKDERWKG